MIRLLTTILDGSTPSTTIVWRSSIIDVGDFLRYTSFSHNLKTRHDRFNWIYKIWSQITDYSKQIKHLSICIWEAFVNRPICFDQSSFSIRLKDFLRKIQKELLRKKCPYSELFWSAFSSICAEYGEILRISPYSVRMWE